MFNDFGDSNGNIRPTKKNRKSYDFQKDVKFVMQSTDYGTTIADTQDMFETLDIRHGRPMSSVAGGRGDVRASSLLTIDIDSRRVEEKDIDLKKKFKHNKSFYKRLSMRTS